MENFSFAAPTELVFGVDTEEQIPELLKKYNGSNVLIIHGNSAVKTGLLAKITGFLDESKIKYTCLGGVVPNPRLSLVKEGIEIARAKNCDFVLAVGGGSAIDTAKAIAAGFYLDDVWEHCYMNGNEIERALPVGCVLTIPAAGSEGSPSTVITNEETGRKLGYGSDLLKCKFSILNPENSKTVPDFHLASGIVDMLGHIFERYFTRTQNDELITAMSEAAMRTIIAEGRKAMANREDMEALAEIVLSGWLAHNDILGLGREQDWASHEIEHELSAKYDITHGSGLAIVYTGWLRFLKAHGDAQIQDVLARFEKNVITLKSLADFYKEIGMPTALDNLDLHPTDAEIEEMAEAALFGGKTLGSFYKLTKADIVEILKA
ncbi:MAG: iron-containing alcohol dehydrogenase [Christensenellaceae bacterium]|jgi:alcohol dehydrogenase YqhD (iron-dependent ADH family)|nr:iron-containing alcohol dehydrogenase [Christensenellaceae bacterium]